MKCVIFEVEYANGNKEEFKVKAGSLTQAWLMVLPKIGSKLDTAWDIKVKFMSTVEDIIDDL